MAREVTSKHIEGITDLVVVAPIREGFIDAYENVTFDTRLRIVMEALHNVRVNAREYERTVPFSDTAERILDLLNYRIGILDHGLFQLDPRDGLKARRYAYLAVTFDGAWEPYMRLVWEPLGTFLDLVFCNCEGYKPARDSSYEEYIKWVRKWQVDSAIFYSTTGLTVRDQIYLQNLERVQREREIGAGDLELTGLTITDPAEDARADRGRNPVPAIELGLEALTVLYRLADYYPPDRMDPVAGLAKLSEEQSHNQAEREKQFQKEQMQNEKASGAAWSPAEVKARKAVMEEEAAISEIHCYSEGRYLLRAARDLLDNFDFRAAMPPALYAGVHKEYKDQLDWYYSDVGEDEKLADAKCPLLAPQRTQVADPGFVPDHVQAGIVQKMGTDDRPVREGALLLMTVTEVEAARAFLAWLAPRISYDGKPVNGVVQACPMPEDGIYCTVGFTMQGLTRLGLHDHKRDRFPKEFREGLLKRAGLMGDLRENHPRNWILPTRNWPEATSSSAKPVPPVEMDEVDFVIQLRYAPDPAKDYAPGEALAAPLMDRIREIAKAAEESGRKLAQARRDADAPEAAGAGKSADPAKGPAGCEERDELPGVVLAAYEPMASYVRPAAGGSKEAFGHFPFRDGISQPEIGTLLTKDEIAAGKYEQCVSRGELFVGFANDRGDQAPEHPIEHDDLRLQGSFLVIRKIGQEAEWFETYLKQESERISKHYGVQLTPEDLQAKLLGRKPDGTPLVTSEGDNGFTYADDPLGQACPLGAHVRRANPRDRFQGRPAPRLMRRGMSFGPEDSAKPGPRGVMFMAYCSSIAEQFETIQRWINGGNSTGQNAAQNDPLIGVHPAKGPKVFRFFHEGKAIRTFISEPFVKLHWGLYLFVPSRSRLEYIPRKFKGLAPEIPDARESRGRAMMEQIGNLKPPNLAFDQWKRILEDFDTKDPAERDLSPDIWSAIRYFQSGSYRIPNSKRLVDSYRNGEAPERTPMQRVGGTEKWPEDAKNAPAVVLVGSKEEAERVLSDDETFSVDLQGHRFAKTSGDIYVAMQRGTRYYEESEETNQIMLDYAPEAAFAVAYDAATAVLADKMAKTKLLGRDWFRIELRRDFLAKTLGEMCHEWFGLPNDIEMEKGAWSWGSDPLRKAICPGDMMAPSRYAFYPQPNDAARIYAEDHGPRIRTAGANFVDRTYPNVPGTLSSRMAEKISQRDFTFDARRDEASSGARKTPEEVRKDVLARNIIGMMIGMLPPIDGNIRGILYEWLSERTLWRHQAALLRAIGDGKPTLAQARVLYGPISRAMCKRPGPDLLYRRATQAYTLTGNDQDPEGKEGDIVIVSLVSVTQRSLRGKTPDVSMIFGGCRSKAVAPAGEATHACPAQRMMMASIIGIMAALLNVGRIKALPSSLIVEIRDWRLPLG